MKEPSPTITGTMSEVYIARGKNRCEVANKQAVAFLAMLLAVCFLMEGGARAQAFRSQFTQIRATVPVGFTNSTILGSSSTTNNSIILVSGASNAVFDVTGLPPGATAVFTDGTGNALPSTTQSTNLQIVLNTTNIPQGVYNFTLNVGGYDTNGLPITNQFPFVLQSAHIWNGSGAASFGASNNWAVATNWLGGVPSGTDDVVIADFGAQTNASTYGIATGNNTAYNIGIDTSMTVASIRFAQNTYANTNYSTNIVGGVTNILPGTTNSLFHSLRIGPGATLFVTGTNAAGTNGFSLLRDTIGEFGFSPDNPMGVLIGGTNGTLMVSNAAANFSVLLGSSEQPTLNMTNLGTFICSVKRVAVADFRGYPKYQELNAAFNGGRDGTNYSGLPRRMWANIFLARTNFIRATYVDPDHYTNEYTRTYALTLQNNEQSGNGSSVNTFFYLGRTNTFFLDSICFIGSSSASGNTGGAKFNPYIERNATNPGVLFRGPDGVSRMSMFCVSDDAGTNQASSNVKATVDLAYGNFSGSGSGSGYINLLADKMYVARDRTLISSNQSPNVQGDLIVGSGIVDVNTVYLGCQEHSNKVDWTSLYGASPYLNYCQGRLVVSNWPYVPSVFRINGNLTLGYTADSNPVGSAQQFNTYGQVAIYSNATFSVSNVICDGGLNFFDSNGRRNTITVNQGGNLIVSNTIGYPNAGANDFSAADPRGIRLDTLTLSAGRLTVFVDPARTNVYTRTLATPGLIPSVIKVAALNNVTNFPAQIPIISYLGSASPFMNADVSALGAGYFGYILNDSAGQTVDLYITTNAPNTLIWTGSQSSHWNTTDQNWVTAVGNIQTNFHLGDLVTFNDSSTVTSITIDDSVVPGQTGIGVTISNSVNQYVFNSGIIAGTAQVVKQGTNVLEFNAIEQGPITIMAGSVIGNAVGQLGTTTVYTNVVLNFNGTINGGLTSTGMVVFAGTEFGPISIQAGTLDNYGTMNTTVNQLVNMAPGTSITNEPGAIMNIGAGSGNGTTWDVPAGATLANFSTINLYQPRIAVEGLLYGNGTFNDPNGGGHASIANTSAPRIVIQGGGIISPGLTPAGTIGSMNLQCRFDYNNDPITVGNGLTPGIVRLEVDFNQSPSYDTLNIDRWNNDTGYLVMTNMNPAAGVFTVGQNFQVFNNANSGDPFNTIDTLGFCPTIQPYVPGPGMQWGTTNFNLFGLLSVTSGALVWDGTSGGNWSTNAADTSWKTGRAFADNAGAVFDDSASGTTVVNLMTNVAPEGYAFVVITNYLTNLDLTITTNIISTTNQPAFYPGIIFSNSIKSYVVTGVGHIRGTTGIYKTGPGTVTLMSSNDFFGSVIIDNGILQVTNSGSVASIVSLGVPPSGAPIGGQMKNQVILDGGTLSYIGTTNVQLAHAVVVNAAGGTLNVASPTNMFTLNTFVVGFGALTLMGPGTVQMMSSGNNYPGGTIVSNGTSLKLTDKAVGYGPLTLSNSTALLITNINNLNFTNTLNIPGSGVSVQILGSSTNMVFSGNWTGSGSVTISNVNLMFLSGDMSAFSGGVSFGPSTGIFQFNNTTNRNFNVGSAAASFDLGTGSAVLQNLNGSNLTYNLGALSGGANTVLAGRSTNGLAPAGTTYSIGANGASTTFSGKITNGLDTVSVIKVGTGALLLNGVSTYTGSTTVSNGVLGGSGSIASPLTVNAGATLAPGASVGTFTVSNSATLNGTVLMELNRSVSPSNDLLVVTGTLNIGASAVLVVTNIGPDIYNGSKFKLFNTPVTFTSIVLPTNNPANTSTYVWNNTLATDGSITLVGGGSVLVNTNSTNIVVAVTNGALALSWPADHLGWRLEVQTNPLAVGLLTNWFTVPGSTNVTSELIPMDTNQGSIFYRMAYP